MKLTDEQLQALRAPFEEAGAFVDCSEEEIKSLLEAIAEIYVTLAKENLLTK